MQTSHDPHAACEAKIFALRAENDDLRRQLDAANSVIRRQVDWEYLPAVAALPAVWTPRDPFGRVDGSDDPVTPAEDAAIRAALDVPAADPASGDDT